MKLNLDFTGATLLKNWWRTVKDNFTSIENGFDSHTNASVLDHPNKSVTTAKIADKAITGTKIADGAVTENKIADGAVTENKIADGAVSTSKLMDVSVQTNKIADKAVTKAKLGSDVMNNLNEFATQIDRIEDSIGDMAIDVSDEISDRYNSDAAIGEFLMDVFAAGRAVTDFEYLADVCGLDVIYLTEWESSIPGWHDVDIPLGVPVLLYNNTDEDVTSIVRDDEVSYIFSETLQRDSVCVCAKTKEVVKGADYENGMISIINNIALDSRINSEKEERKAAINAHTGNKSNPHCVTKSQVGLGNCDNTSDLNKPVSTATQTALNAKANTTDLPNIKKNSNSTTGDIISTHLTVGSRASGNAVGTNSFTSGSKNTASELYTSVIGGQNNKATQQNSVVVGGNGNTASGNANSFVAGGWSNTASGDNAVVLGGGGNVASGAHSTAIGGIYNTALTYQTKLGRNAADGTAGAQTGTTGDVLTVGIGASTSARKNGFRVDYSGNCYGYLSMNSTGADYAEMWEWLDENPDGEDRVGYFVAFQGTKIRFADETDDLRKIGIISGNPAVIGDNFADDWQGMYLKDIYGRNIKEHKIYEAEYDSEGNLIREAYEADEYVLNPDYTSTQTYIPRKERKEWDAVGTHGKLVVKDDGTCQVDGFCRPTNGGIATASDNGFYVMERIDDTHIRVYLK